MSDAAPVLSGLLLGDEAPSSIDATNNVTLLEDVLKANGEEHLHDQIMQLAIHAKDDPPLIFGWKNVEGFVQAIQAAQAQALAGGMPLPADPLGLPAAVNVQTFKEAVLEYARIQGAPARLDITCLLCSLKQYGEVMLMLDRLDVSPWTQRIIAMGVPDALPIACVYVPRPRSNTLDGVTLQLPNSLWG